VRTGLARAIFGLALVTFVVAIGWLVFGGHLLSLGKLGIPTMEPCFIDARTIAGAKLTLAQGLDPLVTNPGDVMGRPMNYPRLWLVLAHLGLGPEQARWLALAFVLAFGAGLLVLLAVGLFSPAVWLGIERANSDLLMFGLLALAAWLIARRPWWAGVCVVLAGTLKLFPIFALIGLCTSGPRRTLRIAAAAAAAFGVYLWWICADLPWIRAGTYHWNRIGYGIDQLATALAKTGWSYTPLLLGAVAVLVLALLASCGLRARAQLGAASSPHALAAFRIGAGVYVGSFCLGSNFDYRLASLLLTVPQLTTWAAATRGPVRAALVMLLVTLASLMWGMTWRLWLNRRLGDEAAGLLLDEALSWGLVLGLLAGLVISMPDSLLPAGWRGRRFLDAATTFVPGGAIEPAKPVRRRTRRVGTAG
jgi:hypothetical protein